MPNAAGKGRGELLLRDDGAHFFNVGPRRIARGLGRIEIGFGGVAGIGQLTLALQRQIGVLQNGEIILEVGLLDEIIDLE